MRDPRRWIGAVVAFVVLAAASAAQATVIGALDPSSTDPGGGGLCVGANLNYLQAAVALDDPSYTVPVGGGTLTSWSTRYGTNGSPVSLEVWRSDPTTEARYELVGLDDETLAPNAAGISTFPSSLSVHAGDVLGLVWPTANTIHCAFRPGESVNRLTFRYSGSVAVGTSIDFDESDAVFGDLLNIAATVEQSADLGVSQTATPSTVHQGQLVQLLFKASNAGPAPSPATFAERLPAGLTAISALAQNGGCSVGAVVTCHLSPIAPGSSDSIVVNARATKPGRKISIATISGESTNTDPSSTNNTASARVLVQANATCIVPKLVGHTLTKSKKLLKQAHCALGKVTRSSHPKGTLVVVSQHPSAGQRLAAGARVAVKLGRKKSH
jgi:Domain of unknown function DUF11/PASTA domain